MINKIATVKNKNSIITDKKKAIKKSTPKLNNSLTKIVRNTLIFFISLTNKIVFSILKTDNIKNNFIIYFESLANIIAFSIRKIKDKEKKNEKS